MFRDFVQATIWLLVFWLLFALLGECPAAST